MTEMNPKVDNYFAVGCMRCALGNTPECKAIRWHEQMVSLRQILLESGLTEEVKWSIPCYTVDGGNVVIMSAFKEYFALSFFKGALLKDPEGILIQQTENTQAARQIRFTSSEEVAALEPVIRDYLQEAIEVEKAGLKVESVPVSDVEVPEEFQRRLDEDFALKEAFEVLTPGRQKAYLIYFAGAKQSKTREARIEKYIPLIFEGIGLHDQYKSNK